MNIGFDAKRYFHNTTGLGNYSRTLVNGLARLYPEHHYFLFNPKKATKYFIPDELPVREILPNGFVNTLVPSLWRSRRVVKDIAENKLHIYHGLSHELPVGIHNTGVRSVVTIHDLIFERYPAQYGLFDVLMHRRKIQYACANADWIIAASRQTKEDLISLYSIAATKIDVCYQSCDTAFEEEQDENTKTAVRTAYSLPKQFLLYVGSITERKNLLGICKGMHTAGSKLHLPLVVVGTGKSYRKEVEAYLAGKGMRNKVYFLADVVHVDESADIKASKNLSALYQMATALVYPSFYEGFGIPVLEALWSRVPVITSNTSCMPETGGDAALYVNPHSTEEIAAALLEVQNNAGLRNTLIEKGVAQAKKFTLEESSKKIMAVYQKILGHGSI